MGGVGGRQFISPFHSPPKAVIAEFSGKPTLRTVAQLCCHEKRLDNRIEQQEKP
jgi:hypothetical protein